MGHFSIRFADSSLPDSAKEERKIGDLMPSGRKEKSRVRKHERGEGSPRESQRKRRVTQDDSDIKTGVNADKDLSLNYKHSFDKTAETPEEFLGKTFKTVKDEEIFRALQTSLEAKHGPDITKMNDLSSASPEYRNILTQIKKTLNDMENAYEKVYDTEVKFAGNDANAFVRGMEDFFTNHYNNDATDPVKLSERAGIIKYCLDKMDKVGVKSIFGFTPDSSGKFSDADLSKLISNSMSLDSLDTSKLSRSTEILGILAKKAYDGLKSNPDTLPPTLFNNIESYAGEIFQAISLVLACKEMSRFIESEMEEGEDTENAFTEMSNDPRVDPDPKDFEGRIKAVNDGMEAYRSFLKNDFKFVDAFKTHKEVIRTFKKQMEAKFPRIKEDSALWPPIFRTASLISNKAGEIKMKKTAQYHGVLDQGHPSGPTNTPWKSIDKRYLGKEHFASIIKCAKDLLGTEWFKSGWENTSDSAHRAALDLAIHTADGSIYQSKIDAPTYNMLLNKLSSGGYDDMVDTMLPGKMKKSAGEFSLLSPEGRESLKSLTQDQKNTLDEMEQVLEDSGRSDLFNKFEDIIVGLNFQQPPLEQIEKLSKPPLLSADLSEVRSVLEKTAAMLDPHHAKYASGIRDLINWSGAREQRGGGSIGRLSQEVNGTQFSQIAISGEGVNKMAEHKASVEVDLNTLVRVAFENPGARAALLPIIAAKKPASQKKPAKVGESEAKSAKSEAKSEAKSAKKPAAKKPAAKKPASKKKHKASVELDSSDYSW